MLNETTLKVISFVFGNCCFIKCVPFDWNRKTWTIQPIEGKRIYFYYMTVCYTLFNAIFLAGSFIHSKWSNEYPNRPLLNQVFHCVFCAVFSAATLFHYNNYRRKYEVAQFINNMFKMFERLQDEFKKRDVELKKDFCEKSIIALSCLAYVDCFLVSAIFLDQRKDPRYIYAHLSSAKPDWVLIIFWFMAFWDAVIAWHVVVFNMINLLAYLSGTIRWLSEINLSTGGQFCEDKLRTPSGSFFAYRCHQVLNQKFNSCFGPIVLPLSQLALLVSIITSNVLSIKFNDKIPMPPFIVVPIISIYCMLVTRTAFTTAASVHILSVKFLVSWYGYHDPRTRKFLRTCRPLRFQICPFFYIHRGTTLKFLWLSILSAGKISLLLGNTEILKNI